LAKRGQGRFLINFFVKYPAAETTGCNNYKIPLIPPFQRGRTVDCPVEMLEVIMDSKNYCGVRHHDADTKSGRTSRFHDLEIASGYRV